MNTTYRRGRTTETRAKSGADFDLKAFHRSALDIGSVGLDVLSQAVLGEFD